MPSELQLAKLKKKTTTGQEQQQLPVSMTTLSNIRAIIAERERLHQTFAVGLLAFMGSITYRLATATDIDTPWEAGPSALWLYLYSYLPLTSFFIFAIAKILAKTQWSLRIPKQIDLMTEFAGLNALATQLKYCRREQHIAKRYWGVLIGVCLLLPTLISPYTNWFQTQNVIAIHLRRELDNLNSTIESKRGSLATDEHNSMIRIYNAKLSDLNTISLYMNFLSLLNPYILTLSTLLYYTGIQVITTLYPLQVIGRRLSNVLRSLKNENQVNALNEVIASVKLEKRWECTSHLRINKPHYMLTLPNKINVMHHKLGNTITLPASTLIRKLRTLFPTQHEISTENSIVLSDNPFSPATVKQYLQHAYANTFAKHKAADLKQAAMQSRITAMADELQQWLLAEAHIQQVEKILPDYLQHLQFHNINITSTYTEHATEPRLSYVLQTESFTQKQSLFNFLQNHCQDFFTLSQDKHSITLHIKADAHSNLPPLKKWETICKTYAKTYQLKRNEQRSEEDDIDIYAEQITATATAVKPKSPAPARKRLQGIHRTAAPATNQQTTTPASRAPQVNLWKFQGRQYSSQQKQLHEFTDNKWVMFSDSVADKLQKTYAGSTGVTLYDMILKRMTGKVADNSTLVKAIDATDLHCPRGVLTNQRCLFKFKVRESRSEDACLEKVATTSQGAELYVASTFGNWH